MSGTSSSGSNGTIVITGPDVIQTSDFYVKAGVLHPIITGSTAVIILFGYLRMGSNRSIAPLTLFDWLINVALGSTLAGIVNGNNLVRGLLGLATLLIFQFTTSYLVCRFHGRLAWIFQSPPLVIVFRGMLLSKVMKKHRISPDDVHAAFRQHGVLNLCLVECAIIEPNGTISIFTMKDLEDAKVDPEVLLSVPAYRKLYEEDAHTGEASSEKRPDDLESADKQDSSREANPAMDSIAKKES